MKTNKLIIPILFLILSLSSCSKNDDDIETIELPPQYPMKTLMEGGHMEVKYTKVNWVNTYEMGYEFKSFKNGKITALGIRIPDGGDFRVTLWNADSEEILVTTQVVSTSGLLSFEEINPIQIHSGVRYHVSVNTNSYYQFSDSGNTLFPIEIGDFLITKSGVNLGTIQSLQLNFLQFPILEWLMLSSNLITNAICVLFNFNLIRFCEVFIFGAISIYYI